MPHVSISVVSPSRSTDADVSKRNSIFEHYLQHTADRAARLVGKGYIGDRWSLYWVLKRNTNRLVNKCWDRPATKPVKPFWFSFSPSLRNEAVCVAERKDDIDMFLRQCDAVIAQSDTCSAIDAALAPLGLRSKDLRRRSWLW